MQRASTPRRLSHRDVLLSLVEMRQVAALVEALDLDWSIAS